METLSGGSASDPQPRRVVKHSIALPGHRTSVALEDQFWDGLHEIAHREGVTTTELIERIDTERTSHNLSSAIRVFVLRHFRDREIRR